MLGVTKKVHGDHCVIVLVSDESLPTAAANDLIQVASKLLFSNLPQIDFPILILLNFLEAPEG